MNRSGLRALLHDNPILRYAAPWRRRGWRLWIVAPFIIGFAATSFIGNDSPPFAFLGVLLLVPLLFAILRPPFEPSLTEELHLSGMNPRAIQMGLVFWPLVMTGVAILAYLLLFGYVHGVLGRRLIPESWMALTVLLSMVATAASLAFVLASLFTRLARPSLARFAATVILVIGSHILAMFVLRFLLGDVARWYPNAQLWSTGDSYLIGGLILTWMIASLVVSVLAFRSIPGMAIFRRDRPEDAAVVDPDAARDLWRRIPARERAASLANHTREVARLRPGILVAATLGFVGMLLLLLLTSDSPEYGLVSALVERESLLYLPCSLAAVAATCAWMHYSTWRRGTVPMLAGNVRLGVAVLRAPVVTACIVMIILLIAARHMLEDWVLTYPSLYQPDHLTVILADATVGVLAIRPTHLWFLSARRPLARLLAFSIVLVAASVVHKWDSTAGFIAATLLFAGTGWLILLRPFGFELPLNVELHRRASAAISDDVEVEHANL